jgi:hypothetical protein
MHTSLHRLAVTCSRRTFLRRAAVGAAGVLASGAADSGANVAHSSGFRLATFSADVTPPPGHPCMGGGIAPVERIEDPLFARGWVLLGPEAPIVCVAVDWCEIRNDAYDRWRGALAEAAGTTHERVLVCSVHQHDAPVADLTAQRILEEHHCAGSICNLAFHEQTVLRVAEALREGLQGARPVTHLGLGQGKVERIASNRRFLDANGRPTFGRTSASRDPSAHEAPEGTIDPWLRTLSFWDGSQAVGALSCYATHPMSYYGRGETSSDFVGFARQRRQAEDPAVFQIYASGCSGNVTAGKYNDGSPQNRLVLCQRLYEGMTAAWRMTRRVALRSAHFTSVPLVFEPRSSPGFTEAELRAQLDESAKPFRQCLAAMGLSWRQRVGRDQPIDVPVIDFGAACLVLAPAEAYVEFQLLAQQLRPDAFVVVLGYGECAPGYIPIERAWQEGDGNLADWCWVSPGAERAMTAALERTLRRGR